MIVITEFDCNLDIFAKQFFRLDLSINNIIFRILLIEYDCQIGSVKVDLPIRKVPTTSKNTISFVKVDWRECPLGWVRKFSVYFFCVGDTFNYSY